MLLDRNIPMHYIWYLPRDSSLPVFNAHSVHIPIVPCAFTILNSGVSQHSLPHLGQVVRFHPCFPSGMFFFIGMQAIPPLSSFFLGQIFTSIFLTPFRSAGNYSSFFRAILIPCISPVPCISLRRACPFRWSVPALSPLLDTSSIFPYLRIHNTDTVWSSFLPLSIHLSFVLAISCKQIYDYVIHACPL